MDADWATVWVALAALLISVVAALFTGLSTWYARGQLDAARRQADVAEAALEFQKRVHELEARENAPPAWRPARRAGSSPAAPAAPGEGPRPPAPATPAAPAPSGAPQDAPEPDQGIDWMSGGEAAPPRADDALPRVSPWTVTHVRGDRYHLTNGSDRPVHDVVLEVPGRAPLRWERVAPGDPTLFRAAPPHGPLAVRWRWLPAAAQQEWTAALPAPRR